VRPLARRVIYEAVQLIDGSKARACVLLFIGVTVKGSGALAGSGAAERASERAASTGESCEKWGFCASLIKGNSIHERGKKVCARWIINPLPLCSSARYYKIDSLLMYRRRRWLNEGKASKHKSS
jgi:hypothetical protein